MYTLLALLLACVPDKPSDTADTSTEADCSTASYWEGGNEESPYMNPGEDCVACHARGEGPNYTVAGTVMGDLLEPDDCNGVEGVTVVITGSDGVELELTTNRVGNFYTREDVALPYTVLLSRDGATVEMGAEQTEGGCNTCHGEAPSGGAPGRITAP